MLTIASPHTHDSNSISRIMLLVISALMPATIMGIYLFGWPAFNTLLITIISALLAEAWALKIMKLPIKTTLLDGSALLTGLLLALSLPPWAPWWIAVLGAFFAIVVGKHFFGGLGQNLFNPAMVGRVVLLISFPLEMTTWVSPSPINSMNSPSFIDSLIITFGNSPLIDSVSGASVLGFVKTELGLGKELTDILPTVFNPVNAGLGLSHGSLGETPALLLIFGGVFLIYTRVITWHIPLSMLLTLGVMAEVMHQVNPQLYSGATTHLLSGAAILGAFFIATDPVGSPATIKGQLIFGAGCGLLVYIIRTWAGFPEGVAFAVLLMNAGTPLIDHYIKPRIYGRNSQGQPLDYQSGGFARRLEKLKRGHSDGNA